MDKNTLLHSILFLPELVTFFISDLKRTNITCEFFHKWMYALRYYKMDVKICGMVIVKLKISGIRSIIFDLLLFFGVKTWLKN